MYIAETDLVFLAEFFEPAIRGIVVHGQTVPFYKKTVVVYPLAADFFLLSVLLFLIEFQKSNEFRLDL